MLFDTHLHLADEDAPADVFAEGRAAGVAGFVLAGTGPDASSAYALLADAEPGVFSTVGVHPHEAERHGADTGWAADLLDSHPGVVAVGEVGLDYYYNHSAKHAQRTVFEAYLALARERRLPVVVHCREAYDDCFAILRGFGADLPSFVLHSYTGPAECADEAMSMGAHFSFNGIATFKKGENVRDVLRRIPAGNVLLETDAPYLAPVPHRGKRNRPAWVACVADSVASTLGMPTAELSRRTTLNALHFFNLAEADLATDAVAGSL